VRSHTDRPTAVRAGERSRARIHQETTTMTATMRFETYLAGQATDPRARARLQIATMAALTAVSLGGVLTWTLDRLGLERVSAPTVDYAVFFEIGDVPPPPSAAPPPRPQASAAAVDDRTEDDVEIDRHAPLEDDIDLEPVKPKGASAGERTGPGVPDGVGPRVPGTTCLVPPCLGKDPIGSSFVPSVRRPIDRPVEDDRVMEKIGVVKENAVYSPDPDDKKLARTKAGTIDRRAGTSAVSFCVDPAGKVVDVRTKTRFPGDPEVDRICRETVAGWRFRPFTVGGQAKKTCSTVSFQIRFD
jgi:protein TonB